MLPRSTSFVLGVLLLLGVRTAGQAADSEADIIKELQAAGLKADKGFVEGINVTVFDDQLTDDGRIKPDILKVLKRAQHIEKLSFGATKNSIIPEKSRISDKGLADLKELGECRALSLRAAGDIKDDGWKFLANLKSLRSIDLTNSTITDAALVAFKDLKALEELVLNTCKNLRGDGFASLKALPKLQRLYLMEVKIEDSGLEHIGEMTALENLHLGDSWLTFQPTSIDYPLTDKGMAHLKNLKNLDILTIRSCAKITDAGVTAALKNKPKLSLLNIGRCPKITDATLGEIKNLEKLSILWVDYTAVTDKGLAELHGLKRLSSLAIEKSKVTNEGIAELKKALPKLTVDKP
jgi:Leucine-rich repeat (LRR) protein